MPGVKIKITPADAHDLMGGAPPGDGDDATDLGNELLDAIRDRDPAAVAQAVMALVDLATAPAPDADDGEER